MGLFKVGHQEAGFSNSLRLQQAGARERVGVVFVCSMKTRQGGHLLHTVHNYCKIKSVSSQKLETLNLPGWLLL